MALGIPDDLTSVPDSELAALIRAADAEERRISDRRNNLQDRLDFLRAGGGTQTSGSDALFEKLVADEQRVSDERKAIHEQIDRLHAERARRNRG